MRKLFYLAVCVFQKGIVIIDSPGVGESDIMDEIVTRYLPQAFAFIYVINSANAGGVQKDRVRMARYLPNYFPSQIWRVKMDSSVLKSYFIFYYCGLGIFK